MTNILSLSIWFGAGVLSQALILLTSQAQKITRRDIWGVSTCLVLSGALSYLLTLALHTSIDNRFIFALFFLFTISFATVFRRRILPVTDEQSLLVWNIIFCYAYFTNIPGLDPLGIVIILMSAVTLINALSPFSPNVYGKAILYAWFLVMVLFLAVSQFLFGNLSTFGPRYDATLATPWSHMLLSGMAFLYISVNAWWLISLIPLPTQYQSLEQRLREFKEDLTLASSRYEITELNPLGALAILFLLGGGLVLNRLVGALPDWLLINFAIAAIPILGTRSNVSS